MCLSARRADIAATVLFLVERGGELVTGQTIFVDGGLLRRSPLVK